MSRDCFFFFARISVVHFAAQAGLSVLVYFLVLVKVDNFNA